MKLFSVILLIAFAELTLSDEELAFGQSVHIYSGGLECYVCDSTKLRRPDYCNDRYTQHTIDTYWKLETGCKACIKQQTFASGSQYVVRECERILRYESIDDCDSDISVLGEAGEKCVCTSDRCNAAPSTQYLSITALATALLIRLFIH